MHREMVSSWIFPLAKTISSPFEYISNRRCLSQSISWPTHTHTHANTHAHTAKSKQQIGIFFFVLFLTFSFSMAECWVCVCLCLGSRWCWCRQCENASALWYHRWNTAATKQIPTEATTKTTRKLLYSSIRFDFVVMLWYAYCLVCKQIVYKLASVLFVCVAEEQSERARWRVHSTVKES